MSHNELAKMRGRWGFTQNKMAEALGLTRNGYQKLESGERNISKTVALLARLLDELHEDATE